MTYGVVDFDRRRLIAACGLATSALLCPARALGGIFGKWDEAVDVIVVGSGAAGLAAAVSAAQNGVQVLLLEKMPDIGGDTLISGGFYGAVDPVRQGAQGIDDSEELFFEQTFRNGDEKADPRLVRVLVKEAGRLLHQQCGGEGHEMQRSPQQFVGIQRQKIVDRIRRGKVVALRGIISAAECVILPVVLNLIA